MATIEGLRSRVRVRLEEAAPAVWTDAELDECVTGALETYAARFPREVVAEVTVASGTTYVPFPDGAISIQRVITGDGDAVSWESYAGTIHFLNPLAGGAIAIRHTAPTTIADLPLHDEGLIVLGAVASALEGRAVQDFKRGGPPSSSGYEAVMKRARTAFDQAMDRRGRRVRSIASGLAPVFPG